MTVPADECVVVGRLTSAFGVQGWLKVQSFTSPSGNLLDYQPWLVRSKDGRCEPLPVDGLKAHGDAWVVHVVGMTDRDVARARYGNVELLVPRDRLPAPADDEVYWHDLVGLQVLTTTGVVLGQVTEIMATGANDVLVVHEPAADGKGKERLLPYIDPVVIQVDLDAGQMTVDWDPAF